MVWVPTRPVLDDWLVANPDTLLMDPPDAVGFDTEIVRVRNCILVPFHYKRLLLQCPLTPREAWVQLAGALFNDGNAVHCQPLIDWLCIDLVRQADAQPSRLA
jgi:hypothetical protein